eukprot:TRINITY_DN1200_c0_g1_i4.p1 TRINITY_DN1200_c0_g1~~TRINITY_DN1200_c0_g1_i4.p1  ORF type:complete len:469 (-),score=180.56 TRINITY_DN1200_c0_g1_i4:32-1438(-)
MCTVFCQLYINNQHYGIHAFLVPLRDPKDCCNRYPGVFVGDCGEKMGANGLDNSILRFTNVQIPRENLLNRLSDVAIDGTFSSIYKEPNERFAEMLGELSAGRALLSSPLPLQVGITIAIRYSALRPQFGPPNQPEIPILFYQSQKRRLIPLIATCYAMCFTRNVIYVTWGSSVGVHVEKLERNEIHALTSGVKALTTELIANGLKTCRESSGSHGYSNIGRIGYALAVQQASVTYEGDVVVLLQVTAKELLVNFKRFMQNKPIAKSMQFFQDFSDVLNGGTFNKSELNSTNFENQIFEPNFYVKSMQFRTCYLLNRLINKMQFQPNYDTWQANLYDLITLAKSFAEVIILDCFAKATINNTNTTFQNHLNSLCSLYGLSRIEEHMGFFCATNYFESNESFAINDLITQLCEQLAQHSLSLTDAFGFTDNSIATPLAQSDNHSYHLMMSRYLRAALDSNTWPVNQIPI